MLLPVAGSPGHRGLAPEEGVVLDALLPKVFALVPVVKVKLNRVLVVALHEKGTQVRKCEGENMDFLGFKK